jgi:hypothetical protein
MTFTRPIMPLTVGLIVLTGTLTALLNRIDTLYSLDISRIYSALEITEYITDVRASNILIIVIAVPLNNRKTNNKSSYLPPPNRNSFYRRTTLTKRIISAPRIVLKILTARIRPNLTIALF